MYTAIAMHIELAAFLWQCCNTIFCAEIAGFFISFTDGTGGPFRRGTTRSLRSAARSRVAAER
jgi:hypothetical protein